MPRKKRPNPLLMIARRYLAHQMPALQDKRVRVRQLDGPPGSPRFVAMAEQCQATVCPHGIPLALADAGDCPIHSCEFRNSIRLLLDRNGTVIQATCSGIHWT